MHENNKLRSVTFRPTESRLPESSDHFVDFLDAIRQRRSPLSPLEAAIRSDTISHLADIVVRTGAPLTWDPDTERIVDSSAAQRSLLGRPMRPPYAL